MSQLLSRNGRKGEREERGREGEVKDGGRDESQWC
jgi:hypothetical protein